MSKEKVDLGHENDAERMQLVAYLKEISQKAEKTSRAVPDDELILKTSHLEEEDLNIGEQEGIEPYSLFIFDTSEIIGDNGKTGAYFKLAIKKELLFPELEAELSHVTANTIEFNIWMLNNLEPNKRKRILATIAEWERQTGLRVRFEGVVGVK